jgi:glycine dehydrogenase subunit 1
MSHRSRNPFIPTTPDERDQMLAQIGLRSVSELFGSVPAELRYPRIEMPPPLSEMELIGHCRRLAARNRAVTDCICVLGAGSYHHYVPPLPAMLVLQAPFLAAYQLSQAELHQGLLQLMYEFQELICRLTGMEVANSGLHDGASTLAEAVMMAVRLTGRHRILISRSVHPESRAVVRTYGAGPGLDIREVPFDPGVGTVDLDALDQLLDDDVACVVVQQPNFFGCIEPLAPVAKMAHGSGALAIAAADPLALALLRPPAEDGFDLVVGDGQPLGQGLRLGGAHFGYLAARQGALHTMPGLYVRHGRTRDGQIGYTLAQQAKSARTVLREKAPSNVGTSSVIPALVGGAYLVAMGPDGLHRAAQLSQHRAVAAAETIAALARCRLCFTAPFFREFAVQMPGTLDAPALERHMRERDIIGPYALAGSYPELGNSLLFCFTEMNGPDDAREVAQAFTDLAGS